MARVIALGVPSHAYALDGGHLSEAVVLDQQGSAWLVYYSERGLEQDRRWFVSEGEALNEIHDRLARVFAPGK